MVPSCVLSPGAQGVVLCWLQRCAGSTHYLSPSRPQHNALKKHETTTHPATGAQPQHARADRCVLRMLRANASVAAWGGGGEVHTLTV